MLLLIHSLSVPLEIVAAIMLLHWLRTYRSNPIQSPRTLWAYQRAIAKWALITPQWCHRSRSSVSPGSNKFTTGSRVANNLHLQRKVYLLQDVISSKIARIIDNQLPHLPKIRSNLLPNRQQDSSDNQIPKYNLKIKRILTRKKCCKSLHPMKKLYNGSTWWSIITEERLKKRLCLICACNRYILCCSLESFFNQAYPKHFLISKSMWQSLHRGIIA